MVKSLRLAFAMAMMCFAVVANAETKSYTENLVVTINEISTDPQPATVNVETLENGNINFTLNNFILIQGEDVMPVGNIAVTDLATTKVDGCDTFTFEGVINLLPGGDSVEFGGETFPMGPEDWVGPMLGEIPLKLTGKMTDEKLYVTIDITMEALGQIVNVVLGENFEVEVPSGPAVVSSKDYTENLVVTINEISTDPQPATIKVETLENGNINFTLNNFMLIQGEDVMPIGNISVSDLALTDENYCKSFSFDGVINLLPGGDSVEFGGETFPMGPEDWVGPMLGEIPLKLTGKLTDDKLYVTIDITMESLGQVINVVLGEDIVDPVEVSISKIANKTNSGVAYDLMGRRVNNTVKGNIYVINGKKLVK